MGRHLYNFEEFGWVGAVVAKGLVHRNFACRENFDEQTRTTPKHYHEQTNETGRLVGGYSNCNEPFGCRNRAYGQRDRIKRICRSQVRVR